MSMNKLELVKLVPERVKGIDDVVEINFYENKVIFTTKNSDIVFYYRKIAKYRRIRWWITLKKKLGFFAYYGVVAYRDLSTNEYLFFNGKQYITVKIPEADREIKIFTSSLFFQIQQIIRQGNYDTFDIS